MIILDGTFALFCSQRFQSLTFFLNMFSPEMRKSLNFFKATPKKGKSQPRNEDQKIISLPNLPLMLRSIRSFGGVELAPTLHLVAVANVRFSLGFPEP